ncbi:YkgJ family cysteine cluster protein [Anaeromyxobacter terrae]|uniref:YkgJ family cysteine cluster protein n=1 Tax=Anaeromyxobacter terrae TaxID=2925406 RepID=UPI001F57D787|nr:YkgJ family cysteine cluster protein [Anaeromyxobacter sp. SG22]
MSSDPIARCEERVASLAASSLARARDEGDLAVLLGGVWTIVEEELAAGRPAGSPAPACGPGCAACCTVNVGTLAIEGAVAAALLRRDVPAIELPTLAATLRAFHDGVRWLEDRERIAGRIACPFADAAGRCAIHAARPLACRSISSLDPAECRRALRELADDEPGLVRMDWLQKALNDAARVTLSEALAARGLDGRFRDVSGMTAAFLGDPGLVTAFLAGRRLPVE